MQITPVLACLAVVWSLGQPSADQRRSADGVWHVVSERDLQLPKRTNIAGAHAILRLDKVTLDAILRRAPLENDRGRARPELMLPLPDGRFGRFSVEESPILAPEIAAAFPAIKTYRGAGLDDRTMSVRFGWTERGFHASIALVGDNYEIDPYADGNVEIYVSYRKSDYRRNPAGKSVSYPIDNF